MKLVLNNIVFSQQKAGGISLLWSEIIKYILHNNIECLFVNYDGCDQNIYYKEIEIANTEVQHYKFNRILSLIPKRLKTLNNERYINLSSDYNICRANNIGNAIIIHDFINEIYENRIFIRLFKKFYKKRAIFLSDAIICVSENTRKDLIKLYPEIDLNKIHVVYNCVSSDYRALSEGEDVREKVFFNKYALFVGRRKGYKNFNIVVEALSRYTEINLVVIGGGELSIKEHAYLDVKIGVHRYIQYTGINNIKLNSLYNGAYSLIYPSEYEGFGIPIIEAQAAGCPVITAKNSSLEEVGGLGCVYLDDNTPDSIELALKQLENIDFKKQIILLGLKNAQKYTPDIMAMRYMSICQDIFNKRFLY